MKEGTWLIDQGIIEVIDCAKEFSRICTKFGNVLIEWGRGWDIMTWSKHTECGCCHAHCPPVTVSIETFNMFLGYEIGYLARTCKLKINSFWVPKTFEMETTSTSLNGLANKMIKNKVKQNVSRMAIKMYRVKQFLLLNIKRVWINGRVEWCLLFWVMIDHESPFGCTWLEMIIIITDLMKRWRIIKCVVDRSKFSCVDFFDGWW